jgi:Tfp pilus assembly protein FimV
METGACEAAEAVLAGSACAEWPEALLLAAQLRLRRGDRDGAAECLERVVAREDTHVEARELLESLRAESSIPQT